MAKSVFEDIGTPYTVVELDKRKDSQQMQNILQNMTGSTTVSLIWVHRGSKSRNKEPLVSLLVKVYFK